MATDSQAVPADGRETLLQRLTTENAYLHDQNKQLRLALKGLTDQMWGRKSERLSEDAARQLLTLFPKELMPALDQSIELDGVKLTLVPAAEEADDEHEKSASPGKQKRKKARWRLETANLPREIIRLPDPQESLSLCPFTGKRMFTPDSIEYKDVLSVIPAQYKVCRYERKVFVDAGKAQRVAAPWPEVSLPGTSKVDASVAINIAIQRYWLHLPFYRIEQDMARWHVRMPRSSQVMLMDRLADFLQPVLDEIRQRVFSADHLQLDATPGRVLDPKRPGKAQQCNFWVYRSYGSNNNSYSNNGEDCDYVWLDYTKTKSPMGPKGPNERLTETNFAGYLQGDGAPGYNKIGHTSHIELLGCNSHLRRYFHKAFKLGVTRAGAYVFGIDQLFKVERRATHFALSPRQKQQLRDRYSLPIFDQLLAWGASDLKQHIASPKSALGKAIKYLLGQQDPLRRCLTTPTARIDNNLAENGVRPLKIGFKNVLFVGHPDAGPRAAFLYTLAENCRINDVEPWGYLNDLFKRLPTHPPDRIGELLPYAWQRARTRVEAVAEAVPDGATETQAA